MTKKIVHPWNDYDNITPLVLVWERPLKISRRFWHFKLRPLVHTMRQQRLTWLAFSRTRSCCCWPSTPNRQRSRRPWKFACKDPYWVCPRTMDIRLAWRLRGEECFSRFQKYFKRKFDYRLFRKKGLQLGLFVVFPFMTDSGT